MSGGILGMMDEPKGNGLLDILDPNSPDYSRRHGGSVITGLLDSLYSGVTLPRDVYQGKVDLNTDEGTGRVLDMAGTAMTGGLLGGAERQAGEAVLGSGPIRAYHGSPHDFDRFDLSKIGTGEGAQAYGHGLYFAENEGVAKSYRDTLTDLRTSAAQSELAKSGGDIDAAIGAARQKIESLNALPNKGGDPDRWARQVAIQEEKIAELSKLKTDGGMNQGSMYEVNIKADPDRFLDWDKPLAEQPHIADALKQQGLITGERDFTDWKALIGPGGVYINPNDAAQRAYITAQQELGAPAASEAFKKAGIPGIRYLDQGSRRAADGTRNYVVFDDSLVDIVRKYGIAGLALLPPALLIKNGIDPENLPQEGQI